MLKRKYRKFNIDKDTFKLEDKYNDGVVYEYVIPAGHGRLRMLCDITRKLVNDKQSDTNPNLKVLYFALNNTKEEVGEALLQSGEFSWNSLVIYSLTNITIDTPAFERYIAVIKAGEIDVSAIVIDNLMSLDAGPSIPRSEAVSVNLKNLSKAARNLNIPIVTSTQDNRTGTLKGLLIDDK